MGEVGTSHCRDQELGGESMRASLAPFERLWDESLECTAPSVGGESRGCMLLEGRDPGLQSASDVAGAAVDRPLVENGHRASREVAVKEEEGGRCSPSCHGNGAHVDIGKGFLGVEEEGEHLALEPAPSSKAPKLVTEEEKIDFPSVSPLRRFGGDPSAALFDDNRDCNGSENALFVSPRAVVGCPLIYISRETDVRADGFCSPLPGECAAASTSCEASGIGERCENLLPLKLDKLACSPCSGEMLGSSGGSMVESPLCSLQTRQGLSFEHTGTHNDHSEADAGAALEETGTSIQEDGKEEKYPCLRLGAEFGGSVRRSPDKIALSSAVEGSISLQASHLTSSVENCSSNLSMVQILHGNNSDSANGSSSCCKSGSLIVFRRSNPKRAASSRSSLNDRKPDQLTQIRNGARKCRKAIDTRTSFLDRIPSITRKRRSSRRLLHLSVWGTVENLIKYFEQNNDAIEIQNGRPEKGKCGLGKKKQQVARKVGSVRVSKTKFAASSNPAHVMDNRSPHPIFPVVVDSESCIQTRVDDSLANLDCKIRLGSAKKIGEVVDHKLAEEMCSAGVKSLQCDGLRRDKDLESTLTQDTCVENMLGECHGVSSRSGTAALVETVDVMHLLDRGTSPDSDVYHPIIDVGTSNSECATPTNQDAGRDQSVLVPEPVDHDRSRVGVLSCSEAFVIHAPVSLRQHTILKKGKKNGEVNGCPRPVSVFLEEELNGFGNLSKAVKAAEWEKQEEDNGRSAVCSKSIRKATRKASTCKSFVVKSPLPGMTELEFCEDSVKLEFALENRALSGKDVGNAQNDAVTSVISLPTDKTKACKLPRSPKPGLSRGKSSRPDSERNRKQNVHGQKRENVWKSYSKSKTKEKSGTLDSCIKANGDMGLYFGTANKLHLTGTTDLSRKIDTGSKVVSVDGSSSVMDPVGDEPASKECFHGLEGQFLRPRAAWVLCDDCHKWRCIPAELADIIDETNCKWTCKDNTDKAFADCSIPQDKTNAEINAELEISDASGEDNFSRAQTNFKGIEPLKPAASEPASWTVIKSNLFLHRNRKTQIIDEVMVCHCKAPSNGSLGCGEECLNRMLNIECVKGTCPCGNLCSNQKFQKRKYAKFKWFRCGKKGYGLQLQEDVSRGQFLIEYVGEVLDFATYEARQRYYASRGQKHFYFMTLNGGEVIDACAKGNLGRFINHSCDPNCRTEKWMINGEVCIGLFAIRDIKKGEEVTFDYNYVRVFGAAAKKCVCGSSECRGFIGGDPLNTEIIVQGDSDEEYLEPVLVHEDGEREIRIDVTVSSTIDAKVLKPEQISKPAEDPSGNWPPTIPEAEVCLQSEDTSCRPLSNGHPLGISLQTFDPIQKEDTIDRPLSGAHVSENSSHILNTIQSEETMCSIQPIEILCRPLSDVPSSEVSLGTSTTVNESMSDSVLSNKESIVSTVQDKPNKSKPYRLAKSSRSSGTIKKGRACAKTWAPHKAKKMPASTGSGHFEGVEEKLNDLLDEDGGISKRKDATKGYLKLLFVTAAEGDNVGGFAAKSTRDLSLILDALLKTKSRMVLVDIIVKNGLQMLHNIMKQNRGNFNRIPIIRKLLKVLEFLALKGILTVEHINRGPPCSGMESFKDSILKLTNHNDIQVHQIARNFRDKWIPRNIRRVETSDREDGLLDSQRSHCNWHQSSSFKCRPDQGRRDTNAIICTTEAVHLPSSSCEADIPGETSLPSSQQVIFGPLTDTNPTSGSSTRKRKSRWDRPSDITSTDPQSVRPIGDQTVEAGSKLMKPTTPAQLEQTSQLEVLKQKSETQKEGSSSCDETASTMNSIQENADDEAPPGFGSPRRNHRQIPSRTSLVAGDFVMGHRQDRFLAHLPVSYGMPVALMQQLGTPEAGGGQSHWAIAPGMPFYPFPPLPPGKPNLAAHRGKEETDVANRCHAAPHMDLSGLSSLGERPANYVDAGARNPPFTQRVRWPSHGSGRRDVRPQRWNNHRSHRWPPWSREGNDHDGSRGSSRNGPSSISTGDPRRDNNDGFCFPECVSNHDVSSNFRQQPHHS